MVLAVGCTVRTPAATQDSTLRIGARDTNEARSVLRSLLFAEGLLVIDWHGRPSPRLAASVPEWDDDGLTLRLRLRPDARFHDGTPVTAPTIVKILNQKFAKTRPSGFEALKRIDAPDDRSLLFRLSRPDAFLTSGLATTLIVDDDKPDIGTGPFRLLPEKQNLEAAPNTSYYRGTPGITRVQLIQYPTSRATWVGLLRNEVNMALEINKESVPFLEGATSFRTFSSIQPFYIPLVFNLRNPILARPEVRRAISEAIDREEIFKQGMRERGQMADDPIWPFHWAYTKRLRSYKADADSARERLDAAGLPMRPASLGQKASRFQLKCVFYNADPQFERIGLLLQRQLGAAGIDLILEGASEKELVTRLGKGQFDSYLFQLASGRDMSWAYRFWHSPTGAVGQVFQDTGYSGADQVLDRLRQARDEDDIRIAIGDLRQRFYEDVPAVFLSWTEITRAVDARFDVGDANDPEIFANLWKWHVPPQMAAR
jgi:peptide/nickel transport system substrate-binding protein